MKLDDNALTELGLAPEAKGRILLIACGALAREIVTLREMNGWDHIDLACLPAILHNHPERIVPSVRKMVEKYRSSYAQIHVVYADCGTGGQLEAACKAMGVDMVAGPHCYAFYDGLKDFADRADEEIAAFYLTDFLVRQFDSFVWKPLGLERHPELRDAYFGNYQKLVYLAQTNSEQLDAKARKCAERLGLRYERRLTGYGDLATTIERWGKTSS